MYNLNKKNLTTVICSAALLALNLFLFGPLNLYVTNITELPYTLSYIICPLLVVSFLCFTILVLISLLFKNDMQLKIVSIIFVIGILIWLQGNVMVWDYGVLDGKQIEWSNYKIYGLIDSFVWVVLIAIAILKSSQIYKIARKAGIFLIIVQAISIFVLLAQVQAQPNWKEYSISSDKKFEFSADKNVIVLVLDSFRSDVFQDIISESPEYGDIFDGFTYFRNSLGGFSTTVASVPLILTGKYYDNSVPYLDYIKEAYTGESIPKTLVQNNYDVNIFSPHMKTVYYSNEIMSNLVSISKVPKVQKDNIIQIYNVTFFRYMPQAFKKYFNNTSGYTDKYTFDDLKFIDQFTNSIRASNSKPVFRYFHLRGVHSPYILNENLGLESPRYGHDAYVSQAKASLKIAEKFLNTLKDKNIYDNSMIFIIGDHGNVDFDLNIKNSGYQNGSMAVNKVSSSFIAQGIPMVLVKPFASTSKLKVSDVPVSLADVPKTIASELQIDNSYPGISMFDVSESDTRSRRFMSYSWEQEDLNKEYMPEMSEYMIDGISWLRESWNPTYKAFSEKGAISKVPEQYKIGSKIIFGRGGNYLNYAVDGWSNPEDGFTWTNGNYSTLLIPIAGSESSLEMKVKLSPLLVKSINSQIVGVYVNEEKIQDLIVDSKREYSIIIPREVINDSELKIYFGLPNAVSPLSQGISDDGRVLGVAFSEIIIDKLESYEYGSKITFDQNGNANNYKLNGWSISEGDFTWTDGKKASLLIPIDIPNVSIELKCKLFPLIVNSINKQRVNIVVEGEKLGTWDVRQDGEYSIKIPRERLKDSFLNLTFDLPDAVSPKSEGVSNDNRVLGVAIKEIIINEVIK